MSKSRSVAPPDSPPSVEVVRQRAKHRLIGVSVLVLAAVLVFPLLFDTQPRPVPVDIPIEIPSRKAAKPLQVDTPAVVSGATESTAPTAVASADKEEVLIDSGAAPKAAAVTTPAKAEPVAKTEASAKVEAPAKAPAPTKPEPAKAEAHPAKPVPAKEAPVKEAVAKKEPPAKEAPAKEPTPAPKKPDDAARAQALLEGKPASAAATPAGDAAAARFIVQVGAFAETDAAQAARLKLERVGLKTYTHVAQTPEGKRTRVRLGPFATRAEAEKAAAKAKAQGLAAAILTL
ncbi:MAG TPA: SPOR domain-containing protein [Burkholderiaceae bacterium]|nr:SPOR domain-containing protein [Burkholderiaceae bacterium]